MKTPGALEIKVTNLGPIVEANVDLRPFTLFIGPSNTGKSYLAIMIYALHRLFGGSITNIAAYRRGMFGWYSPRLWRNRQTIRTLSEGAIVDLFDWVQRLFPDPDTIDKVPTVNPFPDPLPEKISALIRPLLTSINDSDNIANGEIIRCFGLQSSTQLVRSPGTKGAQVILRRYVGAARRGEKPFVHKLDIPKRGPASLSASIPTD